MPEQQNLDELIYTIADAIDDIKGEDINILDLREIENAVCKYFIVCTGNTNTQVNAIADSVVRKVRKENKDRPWKIEGKQNGQWVLIDYVDVVVHIFQPEYREFYDIESLWGDAKQIVINTK